MSTKGTVGQLILDSLSYDRRSKVAHGRMYSRPQATEEVSYSYDVHGAVVAQERLRDVGGYLGPTRFGGRLATWVSSRRA